MTKEWYKEYEMNIGEEDIENFKRQLIDVNFTLNNNEIILYLDGIHCGYCTDDDPEFRLSLKEYTTFLNKNGILKKYLKRNKTNNNDYNDV